ELSNYTIPTLNQITSCTDIFHCQFIICAVINNDVILPSFIQRDISMACLCPHCGLHISCVHAITLELMRDKISFTIFTYTVNKVSFSSTFSSCNCLISTLTATSSSNV